MDVASNFAQAVNLNWSRYGSNPILPKGNPGDWDAGGVAAKSIAGSGETYYMYYQGDDGTGRIAIGLATSTNLTTWKKDPRNPILTRGKAGTWDSFWVGMPSVVTEGNGWKMLYEGSDGVHSRLGLATSTDGVQWTGFDRNPVLGPSSSGAWDDTYVGTASIVPTGTGYDVFYVAASFPPHGEVGLATTPDLVHFSKEPARVVTRVSWASLTAMRPVLRRLGRPTRVT